jgi:hypothetical protein
MRQLIVFVALIAALGIGGYLYLFKKNEVKALFDSPAHTPIEAIDKFREAMRSRNYDKAARYCTRDYADLLIKSHKPAKEVGDIVDDLKHRLINDGLMSAEMKNILNALDPFSPDTVMMLGSSNSQEGWVTLSAPAVLPADWHIGTLPYMSLYVGLPSTIKVIKEGEGDKAEWKLDFPAPANLQIAVTRLNDRYKDIVNPLKRLTMEVKNEPTTKSDVKKRMKEMLEDAARE